MMRCWLKRGLGVVLVLLGWLAAGTVNAQQVIDLFEGKQGAEQTQEIVIGSGGAVSAGDEAGLSSLQIERGSSSVGTTSGGQVLRLPFERFGSSILVKAKVQGREVYFLLDTGATYSTLLPEFARSLGITPAAGNPTTLSQTANGTVMRTFGLIPRLELGDRMHTKVAFTLCESCGSYRREQPIVGLLGLNVLRRYRMTIDDQRGIVELMPQGGFSNQRDDIMPWLDFGFQEQHVSKAKRSAMGHVLKVKNGSAHAIQNIEIGWSCTVVGGESFETVLKVSRLAAKGSSEVILSSPPNNCQNHQLLLHAARW